MEEKKSIYNRITSRFRKNSSALTNERQEEANKILDSLRMTINSDDRSQNRFLQVIGSEADKSSTEQVYKSVTEQDLMDMKPHDLADVMVKNDPTIDKILDDFIINTLIDYSYDCEDPRGNEVLDEFIDLLERKRNPFPMSLVKIFTSIALRGEIFMEVVFDDNMNASNLFVMDPRFAKFEERNDEVDGQIWVLGQYKRGKFERIDAETVFFLSINPLLIEPRGRSMIATAFPSIIGNTLMLQDLRTVIKHQAWFQRYISINIIALREAGFTQDEIKEIVERDEKLINEKWSKMGLDEIPVGTGEVEWKQFGSEAQGRLNFVDTLDRVHDRKSIRGGKTTPSSMGSNEYVAESSSEEQSVQYDTRLSSHQGTVETLVERPLTQVIRSKGIAGKVNFSLKRSNSRERKREAEVFQLIMVGIKQAKEAGIPTMIAIEFYEEMTGYKFDEETIIKLEEKVEEMEKMEREMMEMERTQNATQNNE